MAETFLRGLSIDRKGTLRLLEEYEAWFKAGHISFNDVKNLDEYLSFRFFDSGAL